MFGTQCLKLEVQLHGGFPGCGGVLPFLQRLLHGVGQQRMSAQHFRALDGSVGRYHQLELDRTVDIHSPGDLGILRIRIDHGLSLIGGRISREQNARQRQPQGFAGESPDPTMIAAHICLSSFWREVNRRAWNDGMKPAQTKDAGLCLHRYVYIVTTTMYKSSQAQSPAKRASVPLPR